MEKHKLLEIASAHILWRSESFYVTINISIKKSSLMWCALSLPLFLLLIAFWKWTFKHLAGGDNTRDRSETNKHSNLILINIFKSELHFISMKWFIDYSEMGGSFSILICYNLIRFLCVEFRGCDVYDALDI